MLTEETLVDSDVEVVLYDQNHTSNGLYLDAGGDVDTEIVTFGSSQEHAFRTGNGQVLPSSDGNMVQDWYMQFQVEDDFIYQGTPTSHVQIEIEYLDEGTDNFNIQYDALSGGESGDGRFKESEVITKTGSGEFKTAIFTLSDAYFANRDNGADFRISDHSDGAETILRVTVTLLTPSTEVSQSPTDIPLPSQDTIPENQANMIYHNGVILTMESGSVASAIAAKDERILDIGSDVEMLAYAGPGTALIDLNGRTLMPGFIDGHNHLFSQSQYPEQGMWDVQDLALSLGITTTAEAGVNAQLLDQILKVNQDGELRLRASLFLLHVTNCGEDLGFWYQDHPPSRPAGMKLHIPGIKVFADGGSCNRPAVSFEYPGAGHGDLYFTQGELNQIVIDAQSRGYQVAIHALGDRAIEQSQNAIAAALDGASNTPRHRIEHNALVRPDLIPRYSEIGIVPMIFGKFPTCFFVGDTSKFKYATPTEYISWEWPYRPLIDSNPGLHFAWHSDYPVFSSINPMEHLYGMVTRREVSEDGVTICEPPDWAADDCLGMEEALRFMTIESAYSLFREDEVGSLKVGKLADLIILSDNPLEVDHDSILDIQVLMTMVGGQVEHCIQGEEDLCPGFPTR